VTPGGEVCGRVCGGVLFLADDLGGGARSRKARSVSTEPERRLQRCKGSGVIFRSSGGGGLGGKKRGGRRGVC